jgi:hypothetical protein
VSGLNELGKFGKPHSKNILSHNSSRYVNRMQQAFIFNYLGCGKIDKSLFVIEAINVYGAYVIPNSNPPA